MITSSNTSFLIGIKHFKATEQLQPLLIPYSTTGRIRPRHLFVWRGKLLLTSRIGEIQAWNDSLWMLVGRLKLLCVCKLSSQLQLVIPGNLHVF